MILLHFLLVYKRQCHAVTVTRLTTVYFEQKLVEEHRSFGRPRFLELQIQNGVTEGLGDFSLYFFFFLLLSNYSNISYYCQVHRDSKKVSWDLGITDHVWADSRTAIAKKIDDMGDHFRPAMRVGWLA